MPVQPLAGEDSTCLGQLSPPQLLNSRSHDWSPWAWNPGSTTEATAMRRPCFTTREWPLLSSTRESPRAATKTQHSQNLINKQNWWEFPGGPVVRTWRYRCWGPGSIPGQGLRSCKPWSTAKKENKKSWVDFVMQHGCLHCLLSHSCETSKSVRVTEPRTNIKVLQGMISCSFDLASNISGWWGFSR